MINRKLGTEDSIKVIDKWLSISGVSVVTAREDTEDNILWLTLTVNRLGWKLQMRRDGSNLSVPAHYSSNVMTTSSKTYAMCLEDNPLIYPKYDELYAKFLTQAVDVSVDSLLADDKDSGDLVATFLKIAMGLIILLIIFAATIAIFGVLHAR